MNFVNTYFQHIFYALILKDLCILILIKRVTFNFLKLIHFNIFVNIQF